MFCSPCIYSVSLEKKEIYIFIVSSQNTKIVFSWKSSLTLNQRNPNQMGFCYIFWCNKDIPIFTVVYKNNGGEIFEWGKGGTSVFIRLSGLTHPT